jgi:hypothetical protein
VSVPASVGPILFGLDPRHGTNSRSPSAGQPLRRPSHARSTPSSRTESTKTRTKSHSCRVPRRRERASSNGPIETARRSGSIQSSAVVSPGSSDRVLAFVVPDKAKPGRVWLILLYRYGSLGCMKKTLHIDEVALRDAKKACGAATDTETVKLGLEALIRHAAYERLRKLRGSDARVKDVPRRRQESRKTNTAA